MAINPKTQVKLNMVFLETALAYELGGNWRHVLKYYSTRNIGHVKQFCEKGLAREDEDLEAAIKVFLMGE